MNHKPFFYSIIAFLIIIFFVGIKTTLANKPQEKVDIADPAVALGQPGLSFRYVQTFGVSEQAYIADVQHLNGPNGLFIDGSDNLYVAEELGSRMLKYRTSDGANLLSIGTAGTRHIDNYIFTWLEDVALDGSGNIWVADNPSRVVQYDIAGNFLQQLPAADPWNSGNDDTHFNGAVGVAFDSTGWMYVSDRENHRIQVYNFVGGSPVYSSTIGETGILGNDNAHFNWPNHIAIDSSNRLYVADVHNNRVQRCTFTAGWTCTTFHGTGSAGSGDDELNFPTGIAIDSSDNVYIADIDNNRIKKCTSAGSCSIFATGPAWMHDVAVDSSGNVYASAWLDSTIRKYNSSGVFLGVFTGTSGVPYVADTTRLNTPSGITVTADGSIYVTENRGVRLVKLNSAGTQQWTVGQAGVSGSDNAHFGNGVVPSLEGNPAVDASGRIYVPDTGNNRVQIFNSNGTYAATFGSSGNGNYQFRCPAGVTISPVNSDIYVTDRCNNRIQVFDSSNVFKTQLGTGTYGSSNTEFASPQGVAVDKNGNIYVADADNNRVQKCTLSGLNYTCTVFAGVTGQWGDDFGHLSGPYSVAVDGSGRVYVVDVWNQRVQVFDSSGAYLTTIGGSWGLNSGQVREPKGVALDSQGNVYVTDSDNYRIQVIVPGVPGWKQVNINGFGNRNNIDSTLEVFNGQLYAGVANWVDGASIWHTGNGTVWTPSSESDFSEPFIDDMIVFGNNLYAGTLWGVSGGQIWRSSDGDVWNQVVDSSFRDSTNGIASFGIFNGQILAGTWSYTSTHGAEIWVSSNGNAGAWFLDASNGFNNDTNNVSVLTLLPFKGFIFAGTNNTTTGAEVWRKSSSGIWEQVNEDGFGEGADNGWTSSFAEFNGYLYASTSNCNMGAEVWRSFNGVTWAKVVDAGFGDINNCSIDALIVHSGYLYSVTNNHPWNASYTGTEVWKSANGADWQQVNIDGFGDSSNKSTLWGGHGTTVWNNRLFIGTTDNYANGTEIWQYNGFPVYLPLAIR